MILPTCRRPRGASCGGAGHPRGARLRGAHDDGHRAGLGRQPRARLLLLRRQGGLLAALVDTLFQDPEVGLVEEIRSTRDGRRAGRRASWTGSGASPRASGPTGCSTSCCRTRCATRRCARGSPRSTGSYRERGRATACGAAPRELSEQRARGARGGEHRRGRGPRHPAGPRPGRLRPRARLADVARRGRGPTSCCRTADRRPRGAWLREWHHCAPRDLAAPLDVPRRRRTPRTHIPARPSPRISKRRT